MLDRVTDGRNATTMTIKLFRHPAVSPVVQFLKKITVNGKTGVIILHQV